MKGFIEIHHEGGAVLLSVSHIAEVIEFDSADDSGATIYMDYNDKNGDQTAWLSDESYHEIVKKIDKA